MATLPPEKKSRYRTLVRVVLVALLVVVIVCFRMVTDIGHDVKPSDRWVIVEIVDGDTVILSSGERLRLANIDAPEQEEPYYEEAKQFLAELALGKTARLEFPARRRDKYGRLLAYMFIDSVMAGEALLERGLGYLLLFKQSDYDRPQIQRLLKAQRRAMAAGVGLFSMERTPEEYYLARYGRFRFHRPGCTQIGEFRPDRYRLFETRDEALYEGLTPCRRCRP